MLNSKITIFNQNYNKNSKNADAKKYYNRMKNIIHLNSIPAYQGTV
jgi:Zn-dependent peptidase ImmA (M78 family)